MSLVRPLKRRLFSTFWPPGVCMREKKPWTLFLRLTLGWYVRFGMISGWIIFLLAEGVKFGDGSRSCPRGRAGLASSRLHTPAPAMGSGALGPLPAVAGGITMECPAH